MDRQITTNPVGSLDAESLTEIENLRENFIKTADYYKILHPNCLYISGRKGDGKTALSLRILDGTNKKGERIYKYGEIIRKPDFYRPLVFDIREYSLIGISDHTSSVKERLDIDKYFEKLWKYIIYITAMKAAVEKNLDEKLRQTKNFIANKGFLDGTEDFVDNFLDIFYEDVQNAQKDLDYFTATKLHRNMSARLMDKSFLIALTALRNYLNKDDRVVIIIDTVEMYYAREDRFRKAVQGMLQAVYEIKLKEENRWIDIKLFIPDELYDDFTRWGPHKAFDTTVFLSWKYKELLHFICRRYMTYIEKKYDPQTVAKYKAKWDGVDKNDKDSLRSFWNEFFPEQITDRFGAYEDCFNYILRHSQNKPRQIIHLVNQIINKAEERGHTPDKISEKDVYEGIHTNLRQLVVDNLMPFSEDDDLLDCISNIFIGESNILDGRILKKCINDDEVKSKRSKIGLNIKVIEKILLRSGFIGKVSKIKPRKISTGAEIEIYYTHFDYLMHGHLSSINDEDKCALHSILADFLGDSIKRSHVICVYPHADTEHEGEADELFNPMDFVDG